ncbi:MAG: hypothetical protein K2X51_15690 [Burkholderiales bacterium]|nr:hypothetical protein [Burkholderiales bacterium]
MSANRFKRIDAGLDRLRKPVGKIGGLLPGGVERYSVDSALHDQAVDGSKVLPPRPC